MPLTCRGTWLASWWTRPIASRRGDTISDRPIVSWERFGINFRSKERVVLTMSVPIMALTATATPEVYEDCVSLLHMQNVLKFQRVGM